MRAYYYDNGAGSPGQLHDSGTEVDTSKLNAIGVLYWSIPVDAEGKWQETIDTVARERAYKNRDVIESSRATLGEKYDNAMAMVWKECVYDHIKEIAASSFIVLTIRHMHDDEEIRYALGGSAFFDMRGNRPLHIL